VQKPDAFLLHQNYPNPFNPGTQITFALPRAGVVTLQVYDLQGREVKTLVNQRRAAGTHTVRWDGTDEAGNPVASGVYLYRLHVGNNFVQTRKMVLLK
jgi:flagellar hook assembly protein FlgD